MDFISPVVSCVAEPFKNLITRTCWHDENIEQLKDRISSIQTKVKEFEELKKNAPGSKLSDPAEHCLQRAQEWRTKADRVVTECETAKFWNLIARYKVYGKIKDQIDSFDIISRDMEYHVTRAETSMQPPARQSTFESRRTPRDLPVIKYLRQDVPDYILGMDETLKEVVDAILGGDKAWVGVWGMGGSGKTTLAKTVNNDQTVREHFRDNIMWITVGKDATTATLQKQLNGVLPLDGGRDGTMKDTKLWARNVLHNVQFLLILDDVWEFSTLEDFDLLEKSMSSKILITTRKMDILRKRGAHYIECKLLSEEESSSLFRMHAFQGSELEADDSLVTVAEQITRECGRLPLALEVIGRAMSVYERDVPSWERCLRKLQGTRMIELDGDLEERVFRQLKFSYDELKNLKHLDGKKVQECFLYVAAFPEDAEIDLEDLVKCWRGEDLVGIDDVKEIANLLKDRSLVQARSEWYNGVEDVWIQVHDVLRELCIEILKGKQWTQESHESGCLFGYRIEQSSQHGVLRKVSLPSGQLPANIHVSDVLLLDGNEDFLTLDEDLISCLKDDLKVLSMRYTRVTTLPESISRFSRLRTLDLRSYDLDTVSNSISEMTNLRHLYLRCENFKLDLVSRLVSLEEFYLENKGYLKVDTVDCSSLACLTSLRRLHISFGRQHQAWMRIPAAFTRLTHLRILTLKIPDGGIDLTDAGSGLKELEVCRLKCKSIRGYVRNILGALTKLRSLVVLGENENGIQDVGWIKSCLNLRHLTWDGDFDAQGPFSLPCLESIALWELTKQPGDDMLKSQAMVKLSKVRLTLKTGAKWKHLPLSITSLPKLKKLIVNGGQLESLVSENAKEFPSLDFMSLSSEEQLAGEFFKSHAAEVKIKRIRLSTGGKSWHCIPCSTGAVTGLRKLEIFGDVERVLHEHLDAPNSYFLELHTLCLSSNNACTVLPCSIARLPELVAMVIFSCKNLKSVVEDECKDREKLFPKLKELIIVDCPVISVPSWLSERPHLQVVIRNDI